MYREARTIYFDEPGQGNTDVILRAAVERAKELNIRYIVVATNTGETALRALELSREMGYKGKLVAVGEHCGYKEPGEQMFERSARRELEEAGVSVHIGTHSLSSISRSFRLKWQGIDMLEIIAETLRRLGEGMKVVVEESVMAADAGVIPVDEDVIAVAGTSKGSDTAVVLRPANMNRFFNLKIKEIIGMPR